MTVLAFCDLVGKKMVFLSLNNAGCKEIQNVKLDFYTLFDLIVPIKVNFSSVNFFAKGTLVKKLSNTSCRLVLL